MKMKNVNMATFISYGNELNRAMTNFFMLGIELILLKGLKALKFLIALRLIEAWKANMNDRNSSALYRD